MKCFLISDNVDTQMGMRLAGIDGVVVHKHDEFISELTKAVADEETAVIFVTKKLTELCGKELYDMKLSLKKPLIVEIPDRHGDSNISEAITGYVSEAIGIKL